MDFSFIQPNEFSGLVLTETLSHLGIKNIVLSPGSRSTPYTYAFATDDRFKVDVVLDERSAAFYALGIAKRTQKTVVLLCTSGSAAANYLPAIIEARLSFSPLLIITADRPIDQWDCHAGQTTKQFGIFQDFVKYQVQLSEPKTSEKYLRYLRETVTQAVRCSLNRQKGVVHMNAPFEPPLTPVLNTTQRDEVREYLNRRMPERSYLLEDAKDASPLLHDTIDFIGNKTKILVVIGQIYGDESDQRIDGLVEFCQLYHAPIFCDGLNPVRNIKSDLSKFIVKHFDYLLRNQKIAETIKPDLVIQIGDLPTSKSLRYVMETQWDVECLRVGSETDNVDPSHMKFMAQILSIRELIPLDYRLLSSRNNAYLMSARMFNTSVDDKIHQKLKEDCLLSEICLLMQLSVQIVSFCDLFVSNSMIIRDFDAFWPGNQFVRKIYSSRGVNGIDGINATAIGTISDNIPLVFITGELSFLHDASSLNLIQRLQKNQRILIIVLDNRGGGIFEHLPISELPEFEEYFATPQNVEIESLCKAYNVNYEATEEMNEAIKICLSFLSDPEIESTCLHLSFDRKKSYCQRMELAEIVKSYLKEHECKLDQN